MPADTRPLAIAPYKRLLIGQGTSFIGSMLTAVAVPVEVFDYARRRAACAHFDGEAAYDAERRAQIDHLQPVATDVDAAE